MNYKHIKTRKLIEIDTIVNASRADMDKNYIFSGESHDFWEFQYLYKGDIIVHSGNSFYTLRQGDIIFFRPNEYHVVYGDGKTDTQMWVFSFSCESALLKKLAHETISITPQCEKIMLDILKEAYSSFDITPEDEDGRILRRKQNLVFGSEQIMFNRLEELLILLLRGSNEKHTEDQKTWIVPYSLPLAENVHKYLKEHIHVGLCLKDLSEIFSASVSQIKTTYKAAYGCSPIADFHTMKIRRSKELLAQENILIGEISASLSFDNVYYFSNFFKKKTGFSPTEYRNHLKENEK